MAGKTLHTLYVTRELLAQRPALVGDLLAEQVKQHPESLWIVLISDDRQDAQAFEEQMLWQWAPMRDLESDQSPSTP